MQDYLKQKNTYYNKEVLSQYAGVLANECSGVVGMAMISLKDGIYKLLKKDSLRKGVEVVIENNEVILNLHIIVLYGINIPNVTKNITDSIKYTFKEILDIDLKEINIYVEGVKFVD